MSDVTFNLTMNGKQVPAETSFAVTNPSTGEAFAQCPQASPTQVNEAVDAAKEAFPKWAAMTTEKRRKMLLRCADRLEEKSKEIGAILTKEQGKPIKEAVGEVIGAAHSMRGSCRIDLNPMTIEEDKRRKVKVHYKPLGVVGAITPWNFPVMLATWKSAPALVTGNTLVLKPSPFTPLSTLMFGQILAEELPAGVINIVSGNLDQGPQLVQHKDIRKVTFTGSTATGQKINESVAADLKRVTLELGGNDPAVILPDVDVAKTAAKIFAGATINNGQTCIAVKRVYVHKSQYDEFVDALVEEAKNAIVGDGFQDGVRLGPINNAEQKARVKMLVEDARQKGATVCCGGEEPNAPGFFYTPAVVKNVTDDMPLAAEEQFGPAIPVLCYDDIDDAMSRANNSAFGLGGSIWSKDLQRAEELAKSLETGTAWVNAHPDFCHLAPFGGAKHSGIGVENGKEGLKAFTQTQVINVHKS